MVILSQKYGIHPPRALDFRLHWFILFGPHRGYLKCGDGKNRKCGETPPPNGISNLWGVASDMFWPIPAEQSLASPPDRQSQLLEDVDAWIQPQILVCKKPPPFNTSCLDFVLTHLPQQIYVSPQLGRPEFHCLERTDIFTEMFGSILLRAAYTKNRNIPKPFGSMNSRGATAPSAFYQVHYLIAKDTLDVSRRWIWGRKWATNPNGTAIAVWREGTAKMPLPEKSQVSCHFFGLFLDHAIIIPETVENLSVFTGSGYHLSFWFWGMS